MINKTIDNLTEDLRIHNSLEAVLNKLDAKSAHELVSDILKVNDLEVCKECQTR